MLIPVPPQQVFWAMAADEKLLQDYGIDVNNPMEHKVQPG